jgi:hypothetical protein
MYDISLLQGRAKPKTSHYGRRVDTFLKEKMAPKKEAVDHSEFRVGGTQYLKHQKTNRLMIDNLKEKLRLTHDWVHNPSHYRPTLKGQFGHVFTNQELGEGRYHMCSHSKPYEVDDFKAQRSFRSPVESECTSPQMSQRHASRHAHAGQKTVDLIGHCESNPNSARGCAEGGTFPVNQRRSDQLGTSERGH